MLPHHNIVVYVLGNVPGHVVDAPRLLGERELVVPEVLQAGVKVVAVQVIIDLGVRRISQRCTESCKV